MLSILQISADQFVDVCILAGNFINRAPADLTMNYHGMLLSSIFLVYYKLRFCPYFIFFL